MHQYTSTKNKISYRDFSVTITVFKKAYDPSWFTLFYREFLLEINVMTFLLLFDKLAIFIRKEIFVQGVIFYSGSYLNEKY